jgi:hypothetical protein
MAGVLFEDIFDVKDIDPDGKKFDRGKNIINLNALSTLDENNSLEASCLFEFGHYGLHLLIQHVHVSL